MKKLLLVILLTCALLFSGCVEVNAELEIPDQPYTAARQQTVVLRLGSAATAQSPAGAFLEDFAFRVHELSFGAIEVLVYHEGTTGTEPQLAQKLADGDLDIALLALEEGEMEDTVFSLPYVFDDESIFDMMSIIHSDFLPQNGFYYDRRLSLVNCGVYNLNTPERYSGEQVLHYQGLLETSDDVEPEPPESQETVTAREVTYYQSEYEHSYIAQTKHRYDIKLLQLSGDTVLNLTQPQLEILHNAAQEAFEQSLQVFSTARYDSAFDGPETYVPIGLQQLKSELSPQEVQTLPENVRRFINAIS